MKLLPSIILLLCCYFLSSCQEELTLDPPPDIRGSIVDSNGNCFPRVVNGIYLKDSILTSQHFIDATVLINTPGNFNITTDVINGYSFSGSGTVVSGMNSVRLYGSGQPISAGNDTFHLRVNNAICDIIITVDTVPVTTTQAVYTFSESGGNCSGVVLTGNYTSGTAMSSLNTATLNVTVLSEGPYSLSTQAANGITFSSSGYLTTSMTSITLVASGAIPSSPRDTVVNYSVSSGTNQCIFSIIQPGVPSDASFSFDCGTMDPLIAQGSEPLRVGMIFEPVNVVTVEVNVTTPGSYTINTAYGLGGADGVDFNTTGTFTATGVQTLTLSPNGIPSRGGFVFYNLSSPQATNTIFCSTGAYYDNLSLSDGTSFNRNFAFRSTATNDNTSLTGYDLIRMKGYSSATTTESLEMIIGLPTGQSFNTVGSTDIIFDINALPAKYLKAVYTDPSNPAVVYSAESDGTTQTDLFTITITFATAVRIEGRYSGVVKDSNGNAKTISGSFGLKR